MANFLFVCDLWACIISKLLRSCLKKPGTIPAISRNYSRNIPELFLQNPANSCKIPAISRSNSRKYSRKFPANSC